jgi:hypothetical protein
METSKACKLKIWEDKELHPEQFSSRWDSMYLITIIIHICSNHENKANPLQGVFHKPTTLEQLSVFLKFLQFPYSKVHLFALLSVTVHHVQVLMADILNPSNKNTLTFLTILVSIMVFYN